MLQTHSSAHRIKQTLFVRERDDAAVEILVWYLQKAIRENNQNRNEPGPLAGILKFILGSLRADRELFYHLPSDSPVLWQNLNPVLRDEQVRIVEADLQVVRRLEHLPIVYSQNFCLALTVSKEMKRGSWKII